MTDQLRDKIASLPVGYQQRSNDLKTYLDNDSVDKIMAEIKHYILELIGQDEPDFIVQHRPYKTPSANNRIRNILRAELRNKVSKI